MNTRALAFLPIVAACGRIGFDASGDASIDSRVPDPQILTLPLDRFTPASGLADFMVPVFLTSSRFHRALLAPDASDLFFTDTSGTLLPHEIEQLGNDSDPLIAWVRITDFDPGTVIELHYGGEPQPPTTDPTWPDSFLGVWHMRGGNDSSPHGNNGALHNTGDAPGLIGHALHFHPGDDDWVTVPDSPSLTFAFNQLTVSGWVKLDTLPEFYAAMLGRQQADTELNDFNLNAFAAVSAASVSFSPTTSHEISGGTTTAGVWHNLAFTYDRTKEIIYIDGILVATEPENRTVSHSANPLLIGADRNNGSGTTPVGAAESDFLDGAIDEVRLENVARSAEWIKATIAAANDQIINYP